jgi:predicted nucleotidyltransferase
MERGERRLTKAMVQKLAKLYKQDADELLVLYLRDKVLQEVGDGQLAIKALQVAEKAVSYNAIGSRSKSSLVSVIKAELKSDGRVEGAWLFGSVARGEARRNSDVDIMVELNNKKKYSFFDLADIAYRIEQKINRKVDLVEKGCLKNFALDTAKNDWIKIYG